jgi:hypothetical protein
MTSHQTIIHAIIFYRKLKFEVYIGAPVPTISCAHPVDIELSWGGYLTARAYESTWANKISVKCTFNFTGKQL